MSTATLTSDNTAIDLEFQVSPHNHQRSALWLAPTVGMCTVCGKVVHPVWDRTPLDPETEQLYREEQWT
jgi:hypothetical protein